MKSNIISLLFAIIIIVGNVTILDNTYAQFSDPNKTNLGDLLIRFCDTSYTGNKNEELKKSIFLETNAGEKTDICVVIQNTGPTDATVRLNFVDGTITADTSQKKACKPEEQKENFGQYVDFPEQGEVFTVPSRGQVKKITSITFPPGYSGMSYGCATLQIEGESLKKTDGMFDILSRRGNFIDILVQGSIKSEIQLISPEKHPFPNLGNNPFLFVYKEKNTGEYFGKIRIKNTGNVAQKVYIVPKIKSWFQNEYNASIQYNKQIDGDTISKVPSIVRNKQQIGETITKTIVPNDTVSIVIPISDVLPRRKGTTHLSVSIKSHPSADFLSGNTQKPIFIEQKSTFFIVPRKLILICFTLLFLVIFLTLKKRRKDNIIT